MQIEMQMIFIIIVVLFQILSQTNLYSWVYIWMNTILVQT